MAETAAHLVDEVIPQVPVRQWVLSFPIPLRFLLAAHPQLLSPLLRVINRAISTFLTKQAGLKCTEAQTGAVTLIQRFGSAANLNIHLHCIFLDGVYRITDAGPVFQPVRAPTTEQLQTLLNQIIKRTMKLLTRLGYLIEEEGLTRRNRYGFGHDTAAIGGLHLPHCTRSTRGSKGAELANRPPL